MTAQKNLAASVKARLLAVTTAKLYTYELAVQFRPETGGAVLGSHQFPVGSSYFVPAYSRSFRYSVPSQTIVQTPFLRVIGTETARD